MAGVGVKLNRIFEKRSIAADLIGFTYSIIITIAPVLLVIGTILLMGVVLGFNEVDYLTRELFSCTILYTFVFGLLTVAPFNAVLFKYTQDAIYEERFQDILPCFYLGLAMNIAFSCLLGIPFCLWEHFAGRVEVFYVFCGFCSYISMVLVFYSLVYLSVCKDYERTSLLFLVGMAAAFLLCLFLNVRQGWELTRSMLLSLTVGFFLIAAMEFAAVKRYFVKNSNRYKPVLGYFKKWWKLVVTNFFYIFGLYIHNFVFWTHEERAIIADSFIYNQPYDMASCIAMFTNISATIIFITNIEMHFYEKYRNYSEAVIGGKKADIENARNRMFRQLSTELMNLVRIQFIISVVIYLFCVVFLPGLGFGGSVLRIYPCLAAGYFILFLMYAAILFMYYFNDLTGAVMTAVSFFAATLIGSIFAMSLTEIWYGIGLVIGSLVGWSVAYARLRWIEKNLDTHVFCNGRILKRGIGPNLLALYIGGIVRKLSNRINMQKAGRNIMAALVCAVLLGGCSLKTEKLEELIPFGSKGLNGVTREETFTESDRKLNNPNRGFYQLYEFLITDEGMDYREFIEEWYPEISDISLMFIQINLQSYQKGEISQKGLDNIEELLTILETYEKQLIIRFVYDRKGKVKESEPESLEIILKHMEQLEDTLKKHHKQIFIVQGVFTGNWGEMNGSRHDTEENWRILAGKLAQVTDKSTYLGVRTPAQWRSLIPADQTPEGILPCRPEELGMEGYSHISPLWGRLGLFNDGMLGSESDYGTYGNRSAADSGWTEKWSREDELAFQKELCRLVPNGGETIVDNPYNDLPNALRDLKAMHVTYLNKWHDASVLKKWADTLVEEDGCFNGMDGYTYVERHLGYRFLIDSVQLTYKRRGSMLSVNIKMRNVGFAPIYRNPQMELFLYKEGTEEEPLAYSVEGQLCRLAGGDEAETVLSLRKELSLAKLSEGRYGIYFVMVDSASGTHIRLANQQNEERYGYYLGSIELSQ